MGSAQLIFATVFIRQVLTVLYSWKLGTVYPIHMYIHPKNIGFSISERHKENMLMQVQFFMTVHLSLSNIICLCFKTVVVNIICNRIINSVICTRCIQKFVIQ